MGRDLGDGLEAQEEMAEEVLGEVKVELGAVLEVQVCCLIVYGEADIAFWGGMDGVLEAGLEFG